MNCKMRDCPCFDSDLGLGGACSILVGICNYNFTIGNVYKFEFRHYKTDIPSFLDGYYKFIGDLGGGKIALQSVPSKIEFRVLRKNIWSVEGV